MVVNTIYTEKEFAEFIIAHLAKQLPMYQITSADMGDPFQLRIIDKEQQEIARINLHNAWEDYQHSNEMNAIIDFLNNQVRAFRFASEKFDPYKGIDLTKIYPTIRPPQFLNSQQDAEQYVRDDLVPSLDTLFVEAHEGHSLFLTKPLIKLTHKTEKEIMDQAYENLIQKGWHPADQTITSPSVFRQEGTYHIFSKASYPFQHQFFIPGMVDDHLPSTYLLAFPAKDIAVVLTVEKPITSLQAAKKTAIRTGFVQFVDFCYQSQPRPISHNIYWANDSKPFRLYG